MPQESYRIQIEGRWTLLDLYEFPHSYNQVYSFIYLLGTGEGGQFSRDFEYHDYPWRGGYSAVNFARRLEARVPSDDQPRILAIQYSSPGFIELGLAVAVAYTVRRVVAEIAKTASTAHSVYDEIYRGAQQRKLLRAEVRLKELELSQSQLKFVEEATKLISKVLGLKNLAQLNTMTGNPLVTLKVLMWLYRRIKVLVEFEEDGKTNL